MKEGIDKNEQPPIEESNVARLEKDIAAIEDKIAQLQDYLNTKKSLLLLAKTKEEAKARTSSVVLSSLQPRVGDEITGKITKEGDAKAKIPQEKHGSGNDIFVPESDEWSYGLVSQPWIYRPGRALEKTLDNVATLARTIETQKQENPLLDPCNYVSSTEWGKALEDAYSIKYQENSNARELFRDDILYRYNIVKLGRDIYKNVLTNTDGSLKTRENAFWVLVEECFKEHKKLSNYLPETIKNTKDGSRDSERLRQDVNITYLPLTTNRIQILQNTILFSVKFEGSLSDENKKMLSLVREKLMNFLRDIGCTFYTPIEGRIYTRREIWERNTIVNLDHDTIRKAEGVRVKKVFNPPLLRRNAAGKIFLCQKGLVEVEVVE